MQLNAFLSAVPAFTPLPAGHNGGFKERLVEPAGAEKPNIVMILFDDYGWADASWHRNYTGPGGVHVPPTDQVATPNMLKLVKEGIELNRNYMYKYCSPTRSALQSGRNPYHVNPLNADPSISNRNDTVSGFAAIPRNMTGMATKMAAAGYSTAAFGKWDAGMATPDHTPFGRGYMQAMNYFHHANDYWTFTAGGCPKPPTPAPAPGPVFKCDGGLKNVCLGSSPDVPGGHAFTKTPEDCCAHCSTLPTCVAWTWGKSFDAKSGNYSCFSKTQARVKQKGNCTSHCHAANCFPSNGGNYEIVDLWRMPRGGKSAEEGPAFGYNNTCTDTQLNDTVWPSCKPGPHGDTIFDGYEDSLFESAVLDAVNTHEVGADKPPLFLFWAPHIVHAPLEVPPTYYDMFSTSVGESTAGDNRGNARQRYAAMVHFADAAIGNLTELLKKKGMWENTVIVFSTDNGGPIYNNGSAGANNYPLKGGKMNNWEGGIRGNGWISGGFLPTSVRGTVYNGLTTAWDWYATFCALGGVDPTDHRAAAAGLPAIDSYDHSKLILGTNLTSPRVVLPIGTEPRASNISNAPLCSSYGLSTDGSEYYYDEDMNGTKIAGPPAEGKCTTMAGIIVVQGDVMWKLLTGDVEQDMFTGPHYPNRTTDEISSNFVGHCAGGCLFELEADPQERHDLAASMPDKVAELYAMVVAHEATAFNPIRGKQDPQSCTNALGEYKGFWGPFIA